jgi:hypothetical protein
MKATVRRASRSDPDCRATQPRTRRPGRGGLPPALTACDGSNAAVRLAPTSSEPANPGNVPVRKDLDALAEEFDVAMMTSNDPDNEADD